MSSLRTFNSLKSTRDFQKVYKRGRRKHSAPFVLFFLKNSQSSIGFTASKKVGNAIKRNRAKRLMRALFHKRSGEVKSGHYVMVAKDMILEMPNDRLSKSLYDALRDTGALT